MVDSLAQARNAACGDNPNMEDMPWKSTAEVEPSDPMDSQSYEGAYLAKAARSHHITYATNACKGGRAYTLEVRQEFEPFVEQLKHLQLPDVHVNLGKQKFDIPWDIIDYANKVPQAVCVDLLFKFIGQDRTVQLYKYSRLSGQDDKPTLWLCQKLYIETKQPYVHTIRHAAGLKELTDTLNEEQHGIASNGIKEMFGNTLYSELDVIAKSNELSPYAIFIVLFHQIIERETKIRTPQTTSGLWDSIQDILNKPRTIAS